MDTKQRKYRDLIERVNASYPARNPSDDGKELRLYRCDDCKEINLWTYWQGKGHLDAKILLVGQDWGCPWDGGSQPTMDEVCKANEGRAYDYLHNNPSPTDANLTLLFNELGYDITKGKWSGTGRKEPLFGRFDSFQIGPSSGSRRRPQNGRA